MSPQVKSLPGQWWRGRVDACASSSITRWTNTGPSALAKFQESRCPACVAKAEEVRRQAAAALPGKGEAIQALPNGTQISLNRRPDGKWIGKLTAEGTAVEAVAEWPQGLSGTLARLWVAVRGGAKAK